MNNCRIKSAVSLQWKTQHSFIFIDPFTNQEWSFSQISSCVNNDEEWDSQQIANVIIHTKLFSAALLCENKLCFITVRDTVNNIVVSFIFSFASSVDGDVMTVGWVAVTWFRHSCSPEDESHWLLLFYRLTCLAFSEAHWYLLIKIATDIHGAQRMISNDFGDPDFSSINSMKFTFVASQQLLHGLPYILTFMVPSG